MPLLKTELKNQMVLQEKLMFFLKENIAAVHLCMNLTYIAHLWDDLYDNDRTRTGKEINDAFRIALVDIPLNPFYLEHLTDFRPLMMNAILQWQDANNLENPGSEHDKHMAYMLRASFLQIFNYCAYLVGGPDWAAQVGPDMRRLYEEPLNEYMKEMNHA
jgi:hypothetical protein